VVPPRVPAHANRKEHPVTELLSELKDACQRASSTSDDETIALGESTWIRGLPANAEKGTIALRMGDATIVMREGDIRAVSKDGDHYLVEVGAQANVLLRIEKTLKATVERGTRQAEGQQRRRGRSREPRIELEIGPATCFLCAEVAIDDGKQSVLVKICLPVLCSTLGL
jgi:hypothetical protein